jgi:spore germination cell wall hydrolase CwlJ-like protein
MKRFFIGNCLFVLTVATAGSGMTAAKAALPAATQSAALQPAVLQPAAPLASDRMASDAAANIQAGAQTTAPAPAAPAPDPRQIECMAKVIVHEAGNQGPRGQMAVAQVIRARMNRLHADACTVVAQRGQFFNVNRFAPARSSATWTRAVAIATDTLTGANDDVVPGALYFHAAGHPMKGHVRLAQIEGQVFYR